METNVRSPQAIFHLPQRLSVPLFQRPYGETGGSGPLDHRWRHQGAGARGGSSRLVGSSTLRAGDWRHAATISRFWMAWPLGHRARSTEAKTL